MTGKVFFLLMAMVLFPAFAGAAPVDPRDYQVEASPSDCVNTFTVKLIVAASNTGYAYGVFDGEEFFLERRGTPQSCSIDMAIVSNGALRDRRSTKCLFQNPFE